MLHHDHDAPAWWNFKKKSHLYSDGFAGKGHRPLMQFALIPEKEPIASMNGKPISATCMPGSNRSSRRPIRLKSIASWPRRAKSPSTTFFADCHGTYGDQPTYPEKIVPIKELGTDPMRLASLTPFHRAGYQASWFGNYGQDDVIKDPGGYVAPPLDGIWASAPYFHNGSVPTLWHVLHPTDRPVVWHRSEDGYDREKIGLEVTSFEQLPENVTTSREKRTYFDTTRKGKSKAGHTFPDVLDEAEKRAVLE